MRLLHVRHAGGGRRAAGPASVARRRRDPRAHSPQSVPLRQPPAGDTRHRRRRGRSRRGMRAMKPAFAPLASDDGMPVSLTGNPMLSTWLDVRGEDGGVIWIRSGKVELGQNILTALARIAARALGVPAARIRMAPARTGLSPDESVTSGSLSIQHSGMSLRMACSHARRLFAAHAAAAAGVEAA